METKTAAELVALVVREIREHPEYDHIAGVSVMPRIPQPSHSANWRVELSVSGSWHIPEGRTKSWNDCKPNSISLARMTSERQSLGVFAA